MGTRGRRFRGDPDQVVICSSTTSGRTVTYPYPSESKYTYAESDTNHARISLREGICKSSFHSNGKFSKRTYSTDLARPPTTVIKTKDTLDLKPRNRLMIADILELDSYKLTIPRLEKLEA
ncbi:hypothetical protein LOAG_11062 [Loa loa]|uniref:Uncharacterized protein n=1 Tax=Loa loa TaxID=7209 RepID=A0A1S0TNS3_LOALO|nr:hypothetical protein LOAG_11062 [Loa loa]EFO17441.1 hypothetical protein LOAG_11062 [Loa loa]